jgi:hypothetical protein
MATSPLDRGRPPRDGPLRARPSVRMADNSLRAHRTLSHVADGRRSGISGARAVIAKYHWVRFKKTLKLLTNRAVPGPKANSEQDQDVRLPLQPIERVKLPSPRLLRGCGRTEFRRVRMAAVERPLAGLPRGSLSSAGVVGRHTMMRDYREAVSWELQ